MERAVDLLGAVLSYRVLITGDRVDGRVGAQVVAVVLAWLATTSDTDASACEPPGVRDAW